MVWLHSRGLFSTEAGRIIRRQGFQKEGSEEKMLCVNKEIRSEMYSDKYTRVDRHDSLREILIIP